MTSIKELIADKSLLNQDTLKELKELVEKYPFYQTARLLYLENLFVLHSKSFSKELKNSSALIPDRKTLFLITEGKNYDLEKEAATESIKIETEEDSDRTISLINNFLTTQKGDEEEGGTQEKRPSISDVMTDYASFLLATEDKDKEGDNTAETDGQPKMKGGDLIDNFIEETKGRQRITMTESPDGAPDGDDTFTSPELTDEDEEIYTENMVNIYIRQERYKQALEILRKISLNNPEKNAIFAQRIKLLEVIVDSKS